MIETIEEFLEHMEENQKVADLFEPVPMTPEEYEAWEE